jgi:hypothetical protein
MFELRPLGKGHSIVIDTGKTPIPGFPMRLGSTGGTWTRQAPTQKAVRHYGGQTLFYSGEVLIKSLDPKGSFLAACAKRQAEFLSTNEIGTFGRIRFPYPSEYTNMEINRWGDV